MGGVLGRLRRPRLMVGHLMLAAGGAMGLVAGGVVGGSLWVSLLFMALGVAVMERVRWSIMPLSGGGTGTWIPGKGWAESRGVVPAMDSPEWDAMIAAREAQDVVQEWGGTQGVVLNGERLIPRGLDDAGEESGDWPTLAVMSENDVRLMVDVLGDTSQRLGGSEDPGVCGFVSRCEDLRDALIEDSGLYPGLGRSVSLFCEGDGDNG